MIGQELRYVLRLMGKRPGVSFVVVTTLMLAIGANTLIFSLVDAVLLEPLPYAHPDRLVALWEQVAAGRSQTRRVSPFSFRQWQARNEVFDRMALYGGASETLLGGGNPIRLFGSVVTEDFFPLLGVEPLLGRTLQEEDYRADSDPVAVISHSLWKDHFGGDPEIIGKPLRFEGGPTTIVGVLPPRIMPLSANSPGFTEFGTGQPFFWAPLSPVPEHFGHVCGVLADLRPDVTLDQAKGFMATVARRMEADFPDSHAGLGVKVVPLKVEVVGEVRPALWILLGAVGLVLMIASANVSGTMLVRAEERAGEFAIRSALGSGSAGIARLIALEGLVYVVLGGVLGLPLAWLGIRWLPRLIPLEIPRLEEAKVDLGTMSATLGICAISALVCGLAPALSLSRQDPARNFNAVRGTSRDASKGIPRQLLVGGEVALVLVLVVTSGLLIRSFVRLVSVDPGFEPRPALILTLENPSSRYPEMHHLIGFHETVRARVGALPGVRHVAAAYDHPMATNWSQGFLIEGEPPPPPDKEQNALFRTVTPDYFEALGISLLAGRGFTEADDVESAGVVILNEEFTRAYFGDRNPIGAHLRIQTNPWVWGDAIPDRFRVVGIVGNIRFGGPDRDPVPAFYIPYRQAPHHRMEVIVQTKGDPAALAAAVRAELREIDSDLPIARMRTLDSLVDGTIARPRFYALLIGLFTLFSMCLALVGVWGMLSHLVRQRRHEIGVRMALGATPTGIFHHILGQGLRPVLAGAGLGVLLSLASNRLLQGTLFGISPTDATTYITATMLLITTTLLACAAPALKAARTDPVQVLKDE